MPNKADDIIIEQSFNVGIEILWNAITQLEHMQKWYFPMLTEFKPEIGFKTKFTVQVEDRVYVHNWKITELELLKKIAYEWTFDGYSGRGLSIFEVMEEGAQSILKLTDINIEDFPDDVPEFKRESAVQGWTYLIKESLVNFLT